jgi:hypothetical protein
MLTSARRGTAGTLVTGNIVTARTAPCLVSAGADRAGYARRTPGEMLQDPGSIPGISTKDARFDKPGKPGKLHRIAPHSPTGVMRIMPR